MRKNRLAGVILRFLSLIVPLTITLMLSAGQSAIAANTQDFPGVNGVPFRTLQGEVQNLQSQVDQLNNSINQLEADLAALQGQVAAALAQIAALQTQINANKAQITTLQNQVNTNNTQITTLQNQVNTNNTQITALQNQVNTNTAQITYLQGQLASLSIQQTLLTSQVNALQAFNAGLISHSCAAGSSIRQINYDGTTVCEIDTGNDTTIYFQIFNYSAHTGHPADLYCPDNSRFINGGYSFTNGISISAALPLGNGYTVQAFNSADSVRNVTVLVTCSPL